MTTNTMHGLEGGLFLQLAVAALLAATDIPGLVDGGTGLIPVTPAPVIEDVLPAALASLPPPPPPAPIPEAVAYAQLPADTSVPVFIPPHPAAPGRMAVPNANPGYSPTLTLTFDDCGEAATIGKIVDVLQRSQRQALFFVTGQCRDRYPWLVGQLKAAGHQVCNHTYSHPDLRKLSDAGVRAEIARGVFAGCPYFRPPYGAWDGPRGRVARIAAEFGLSVLMWDVDTRDWAGADSAAMAAAVRARGGVILFHLHGAHTVEALEALG